MEWISQKGVRYILHPKRGAWTSINGDIACCVTAKGQDNWIGTFISPDIDHIERIPVQGGQQSVRIYCVDGRIYDYDGSQFIQCQNE